ncbi:MAG: ZIP family metal transporter [Rhodospirillales bacterium]|nr:ZIP family metal transporter [Rhodospirillales bacterium]
MITDGLSVFTLGVLGSFAAGAFTAVGALPVFFGRDMSDLGRTMMLAAAAGIMLGATVFSLIVPGLEIVEGRTGSPVHAALVVGAGVLLGALTIWIVHAAVPHEHFVKGAEEGRLLIHLGRHWLFIVAITLHNFPEGMSVGVSYGGGDIGAGLAVTIGIAIQNMPEGLAVAASLVSEGFERMRAFRIAVLTGLVEPIGGIIGAAAGSFSEALLPWGLTFAAGAMLFVISGEVIPETHRRGTEHRATFGLVLGFIAMMLLDVTLG